ncbi:YgaP family membrane protein [Hwanghaeella grinnelliae]|uniref:YgaP family membrane protein n=1 Tax=Hwanghaeella grinnelliae TaxID=2500179 RepID=UPI0013866D88|nr:DUF2892 domain-containing protein [Hwanghaeella grinnelliae]
MFNKNMHILDSALRLVLGGILVWAGFFDSSFIANTWVSVAVGLFGVLNVVSAVIGFCPVYHLAGLSSRRSEG